MYRARHVETGKIFALKKVRFDNFQPESVRFMSREISILRRLDYPNIMKLEGIITSRISCSMYLVFEYMEHDLAGLVSCPDIKFSVAQVHSYTNYPEICVFELWFLFLTFFLHLLLVIKIEIHIFPAFCSSSLQLKLQMT